HPVCIAVERVGGKAELRMGILSSSRDTVVVTKRIPLSDRQWKSLVEAFDEAGFWSAPRTLDDEGGVDVDGDSVVIEAASGGRYHVIDRSELEPAFEGFCRRLLDLSGFGFQRLWRQYHTIDQDRQGPDGEQSIEGKSR